MNVLYSQTNDSEILEANVDVNLSLCIRVRGGNREEDIAEALKRVSQALKGAVNGDREDLGTTFAYVESIPYVKREG